MRKVIFQLIVTIALFFAVWFALSKVDWMTIFKVEQVSKTTEEKLGDLFWDLINESEKVIQNKKITAPLDSLLSRICVSNDIDQSQVKLHIIQKDDINAFALPYNHLIIYSGLISASENEEEISGVICHELAHMELNHVMKKLIKEVGLSVLISMTIGNNGSDMAMETAKVISSTAYDRSLEREADIKAVDYLVKSNINPEGFANFLYKLSENESQLVSYLSWISSHPDSKERAEYVIEYSSDKPKNYQTILAQETWDELKVSLKELLESHTYTN